MIRAAAPTDIMRLLEMGEAYYREAGWQRVAPFDRDSFAFTCGALMDTGIFLVGEKGGEVSGMAGMGISRLWWNRNVVTGKGIFWYVAPNCRRSRRPIGPRLLEALEAEATSLGVKLVDMTAEEGPRSDALSELYLRRGFQPAEKQFWKALAA